MSASTADPYGWDPSGGLSLDKIRQDLKTALRGKDHAVRDTLRQIMSEFPSLTVPITLESGKKTTRPKKPEEIAWQNCSQMKPETEKSFAANT